MLRPYQQEAEDQIILKFMRGYRRLILDLPTGGGKTEIMASLIKKMINSGRKVLLIVHKQELAFQAQKKFNKQGLTCDIVMGIYQSTGADLTIGSIQTLPNRPRLDKDIIFIDECHHAVSDSYLKFLYRYKDCYMVGATATPYRLDGKPLGQLFEDIVTVTSYQELMDQGWLVPAKYYAAKETISLDHVGTVGGDYNSGELFSNANKKFLYKNVVDNYMKFCTNGERAAVFCINKDHSKLTAQEFLSRGIRAMHLDCDVPRKRRREIITLYEAGVYQVLCNVGMISEGFDLASLFAVILNRATKSRSLYMQMIGRVLRPGLPGENKTHAVVIDQANNICNFGFAEDHFEFDIHKQKKEKVKGDAPVKKCKNDVCGLMMHASILVCANCGYIFPTKEREERSGDFAEVVRFNITQNSGPRAELPPELRKKPSLMTMDELKQVQKIRKYKPGWIYHQQKLSGRLN